MRDHGGACDLCIRPKAKFEDVLNFNLKDTNVGLVVDSGAFYDMMSETDYDKLQGKI